MQRGARFSHFHCKFPPHSLRGICANFRQPVRKKGFMTRSEVQGAISRADKRYESDPQTINGALNFLLSKKVLLRKDDKLYFDQERSEYVLQCCKEGMEAQPSPADDDTRIQELIRDRGSLRSAPENDDAIPPESHAEPEPDAPECAAAPVVTDDPGIGETASLPAEEAATTADHPPTHVLYLTPVEADIWDTVVLNARRTDKGAWRLRVPVSAEALYGEWASKTLACDEDEYFAVFQRFVEKGLLQRVGDTNGGSTYVLRGCPADYHVVRVENRPPLEVSKVYLDIIGDIQSRAFTIPSDGELSPAFTEWVRSRFPSVTSKTTLHKLRGYRSEDRDSAWGIFLHLTERDAWLVCLRGFEAYEFVPIDKAPRRVSVDKAGAATAEPNEPERRPVAATPALPAPVAPRDARTAPKSLKKPDLARLSDDDLQARLEVLVGRQAEIVAEIRLIRAESRGRLETTIAELEKTKKRLAALAED